MNIGITGASGLIGRAIIDLALRRGHEVIAFTRTPARAIPGCTMRLFSLETPPDLAGCEALIHLAGESVVGLWTPAKKRRIVQTRVLGTRRVVEALAACREKPEVLVCGSAIGFYGDSGDTELTELAPPGRGFLPDTVQAWEAEALRAAPALRVVQLRTALVLARGHGTLGVLAPLYRAGLGGQIATGRQWMSWIHVEDEARLALFAVENLDLHGPLNAAATWPVRNADFTRILARTLRRPALFRVPSFALKMLGDFSHELLDSKRVVPAAALEHGFAFRFPELAPALQHLVG